MGEFVGDKNLTVIKMHGTTIKIKCKVQNTTGWII